MSILKNAVICVRHIEKPETIIMHRNGLIFKEVGVDLISSPLRILHAKILENVKNLKFLWSRNVKIFLRVCPPFLNFSVVPLDIRNDLIKIQIINGMHKNALKSVCSFWLYMQSLSFSRFSTNVDPSNFYFRKSRVPYWYNNDFMLYI